jgi:hypothetical protein
MRALEELIDTSDPGWPVVAEMLGRASNKIEVLPASRENGERTLVAIQVTTRSPLGAIAYGTGGILIDHGWLRILGSGHRRLARDLAKWNFPDGDHSTPRLDGACLVADDAVGGFFALNGGGLPCNGRNVCYLAPDTLEWEDTGRGYTDFLQFACVGDLNGYYGDRRWTGWERDVATLAGDRAFLFYPMLFAKSDGGIEARHRKDVPVEELWGLHAVELARQLVDRDNAR